MRAVGATALGVVNAEQRALAALASASMYPLARVIDSNRALDVAFSFWDHHPAVIRCVEHREPEDHTALATMIAEGDFIWGAVVYEQGKPPHSPGLIESFHMSQLDLLVARLVALREACRGAG